MADTTSVTPAPRKRRGWLWALAGVFGVLVVLLVVVYFVATSSGFLTGVILPRVSKAMNAQITVSDASISPFSQVVLRGLKVQTTGPEPLVSAAEVRLRYSLMDIMRGNIRVDEVTVASATVSLIENADGTRNLDPLLKAQPQQAAVPVPVPPAKPAAGKPLQIDLKKIALTDATIRRVKNYANGQREVAEVSHVNVTLEDLKNGQTGKLALGADISVQQTNATLQARLAGNFTLALAADLMPAPIKGSMRLDVTKAEGVLAEAAGFGSELNVEVTPTDIKEVALRFQKGSVSLGELRVSGPFDMQKLEGRLSIVLAGIDKKLLNLAGARNGMDFGGTMISSTNQIELAKGGSLITAKGQFDLINFQLTRTNQTTPRLDLREAYDVTVDRSQSMATLRSLTLTGAQNGNTFLNGGLTSPMQIPLGTTNIALVDATLTVAITSLDLADWKPFLGDGVSAGMVNMTAKVRSQQGDQQITLALDSRINGLAVNAGSNHIADVAITLHTSAQTPDLNQFKLTDYKLEVAHQNDTLTTVTASGTYDKTNETADIQVGVQAALPALLRTVPQPGMTISSGTVLLKAHVTQKQKTQAVTGSFALADFSGQFGTNAVHSLGTTVDFDVGMASQQVQIKKLAGKLTQGADAAGSFDVSGTYDSGTTNADMQATAQLLLAALIGRATAGYERDFGHSRTEDPCYTKAEDASRHGQPGAGGLLGAVWHERAAQPGHGGGLRRGDEGRAGPNPQVHGQADPGRQCGRQLRRVRHLRLRQDERQPDREADGFQPERPGGFPPVGAGGQEARVRGGQRQRQRAIRCARGIVSEGGLPDDEPGGEGPCGQVPRHAAGGEDANGCLAE